MNAAPVKEVQRRIAIHPKLVRITKNRFITICRRPYQGNPLTGGKPAASNLNWFCRHTAVGDERSMHAQYLIDRGRK